MMLSVAGLRPERLARDLNLALNAAIVRRPRQRAVVCLAVCHQLCRLRLSPAFTMTSSTYVPVYDCVQIESY